MRIKKIRVNQLDQRHPCSIYRPLMTQYLSRLSGLGGWAQIKKSTVDSPQMISRTSNIILLGYWQGSRPTKTVNLIRVDQLNPRHPCSIGIER